MPLPPPTIEAVGVLERRPDDERASGRQGAGDGVDRCHLEGRLEVERRQHPRHPLGKHRLAAARRAEQQRVVTARGTDLDGGPAQDLPRDVDHVERLVGRRHR